MDLQGHRSCCGFGACYPHRLRFPLGSTGSVTSLARGLWTGKSREVPLITVGVSLSEENEKHEKLRLEREQEQKATGKASVPRTNSAIPLEEPRSELLVPISSPAPAPPPPQPLAAPISVIPIPVVTSPPQQAAQTTLSPPLVRHQPLVSTPSVTKEASSVAPVIQRPPGPLLPDGKAATPPSGSPKQLQHYAAPVLAISQHHVVQQPIQPQPHQPLQHPGAPPQLGALKLAPAEDMKPNEQKKRPGG